MKRKVCWFLSLSMLLLGCGAAAEGAGPQHKLLYQGHGSLRIVTGEGKVIYVDPYAGEGYDLPADLILVTHGHQDHTAVKLIKNRNDGCQVITWKEALSKGNTRPLTWALRLSRRSRPEITGITTSRNASGGSLPFPAG